MIVPSWYPSRAHPFAGRFVQDQVEATLRHRPDIDVTVVTWGHLDGALSLRHLGVSWRALQWRRHARPRWRECAERWHERLEPALSWTLALAGGNAAGLLRAARCAFRAAVERGTRPHLLHAHAGYPAGWMAWQIAREQRLPFVVTEHMSPFPFPAIEADATSRQRLVGALRAAAARVAVGPALAAQIGELGVGPVEVIPNVVDVERFTAGPAPQTAPYTFIAIGGPSHRKGTDVLLDALAQARFETGRVRLVVVGPEPDAAFRAQAARLGLGSAVHWHGPATPGQVPALLAGAHALVLASRAESFGVVLVEALAAGRPVVATRSGGPESIVRPGDGLLVAPGDAPALAAALRAMVEAPGHHDPAVLRAGAHARFGAAAVAGRIGAVYDRVLTGPIDARPGESAAARA